MSESEEIELLWREVRILHLQVAMLSGLLWRTDRNNDALRLILNREYLEAVEIIDRDLAEKDGQAR